MKRWIDAGIAAAAAAFTNFFYYLACDPDWYFPDSYTYLAPARNLLRGLGFVTEPGLAETLRTPGYPLILAAFGTRSDPVIFAQHLANVLLAAAIVLLARRHLSRFAALAAGLIFAVDVPTMHYANKILTETFFTLLLFGVFAMLVEGKRRLIFPLAGLLTGFLVLIRPVAIGYFVVALGILMLRGVRRREMALFAILALAPPLGWAARNWRETGVFTVSSIGNINLLICRAAGALALERGGDFEAARIIEQRRLEAIADAEIRAGEHVGNATDVDPAVVARYQGRLGRRVLLQHPWSTVKLTARGFLVNLFDSRWDAMLEPFDEPSESFWRITVTAWTFLLFALAAAGSVALWRADRTFAVAVLGTIFYFLLISAGGESESRFRVPVVPHYAIAAGAGLDAIRRRLRGARR
jgi:4-amino-4-deoxy-L-arabinose transferase-like glycosyltransferase